MQNKLSLEKPLTYRHKAPVIFISLNHHNTEMAMRKLIDKEHHEQ